MATFVRQGTKIYIKNEEVLTKLAERLDISLKAVKDRIGRQVLQAGIEINRAVPPELQPKIEVKFLPLFGHGYDFSVGLHAGLKHEPATRVRGIRTKPIFLKQKETTKTPGIRSIGTRGTPGRFSQKGERQPVTGKRGLPKLEATMTSIGEMLERSAPLTAKETIKGGLYDLGFD